jgi:hypothetical protein
MRLVPFGIGALLLAAGVALAAAEGGEKAPAETASAATAPEPSGAEVEERALAIIRRAGHFLRDQQRLAVTVHTDYDAVQPESGEKLEFGGSRRILIQRPDRMRIESQPRDRGPRVTTFDGRLLTVLDVEQKAYAQVEREGDLDSTLDFVQDDLAIRVPLAELWRSEPSRDLEEGLQEAYVVGRDNLDGVKCDHVFLRNERADGQFWIERGETPRLHRIVITYRNDEGQPALRARFSDWSFTPPAGDEAFRFEPPDGAQRILFAARPRAAEPEGQ